MEIYVDVLFLMNFLMDFLLIKLTSDILSVKIKFWRVVLTSVIGGILGVCYFIPDLKFAGAAVTSLIESGIIIFTAFGRCKIKEFLKRLGIIYGGSMLFSGIAILDMLMFNGGMIKNGVFYANSPRIVLTATILYFIARRCISKLKRRASQKMSGVVLEYGGRRVSAAALTDTGNGLTEPFSKKPVMIIKLDILQQLVGAKCNLNNLCEWIESEKIRIIPYHTIDCDGILTGVVLDRIYIDGRRVENVIAAVSDKNLKYPVILHAGI